MTDIVVMSLESWDAVWRRNQYLIAGLLERTPDLRALFVEPRHDPLYDLASRRRIDVGEGLRPVVPEWKGRLWRLQATKWLPRRLDPWSDRRAAGTVDRRARSLGFSRPVLWVNDPGGAAVLRRTGWPALYDITDDWLEADRTRAEHERLVQDEDYLMAHCAEVVVCSPALASVKGARRPVNLIPNAVDVPAYRVPQPRPADLPDGPIALYLGTIHRDRIDIELCCATARGVAGHGSVVLVGPAPLSADDSARLEAAGVNLLGARDRSAVPGYLQHADVLIVPHVVTPFTDSLDPIKSYEYRAVGRPVVSTPVAGFRDAADSRVQVRETDAFVRAVRDALPAGVRFPEGADAAVPTWEDRAAAMAEVIDRVQRRIAS